MKQNNNLQAFYALVRVGLWERIPVHDSWFMVHGSEQVDWEKVYQLAEEQSVLGVVLAGLEHSYVKPPQELLLQWIGEVQMLEQQNLAMNSYINTLNKKLAEAGISSVLLKGQGVGLCYERPLWRACGDIDLLLDANGYENAKKLLSPLAENVEKEFSYFKHVGMTLDGWEVELHGTFQSRLSKRIDNEIDRIQKGVFMDNGTRAWHNDKDDVLLPNPDADVIFIFTHILHHYFFEGIGLRQFCDWCRLLWTYRSELDSGVLESRLQKMGLMTEWKAFAAFAVDYLGMPLYAMPLYSDNATWKKKALRISAFVIDVGNFGHKQRRNYDGMAYFVRKFISFWGRLSDILRHFMIFPKDSIVFFGGVIRSGMYAAVRGE